MPGDVLRYNINIDSTGAITMKTTISRLYISILMRDAASYTLSTEILARLLRFAGLLYSNQQDKAARMAREEIELHEAPLA